MTFVNNITFYFDILTTLQSHLPCALFCRGNIYKCSKFPLQKQFIQKQFMSHPTLLRFMLFFYPTYHMLRLTLSPSFYITTLRSVPIVRGESKVT